MNERQTDRQTDRQTWSDLIMIFWLNSVKTAETATVYYQVCIMFKPRNVKCGIQNVPACLSVCLFNRSLRLYAPLSVRRKERLLSAPSQSSIFLSVQAWLILIADLEWLSIYRLLDSVELFVEMKFDCLIDWLNHSLNEGGGRQTDRQTDGRSIVIRRR